MIGEGRVHNVVGQPIGQIVQPLGGHALPSAQHPHPSLDGRQSTLQLRYRHISPGRVDDQSALLGEPQEQLTGKGSGHSITVN